MVFIALPIGALGFYFNKFIIKHERAMYIIALVLGIISVLKIDSDSLALINDGFLGLGFFIVVMYTGGFKRNSKLNKKLRSVRKIFSIMGATLIVPHIVLYLGEIISGDYDASIVVVLGIITALIMLPLTIISFKSVKRKFPIKKWFHYQKYAYLSYFFLFLHLIMINNNNQIFYFIIFGLYFSLKLKNYLFQTTHVLLKVGVLVVLLSGLFLFSGKRDARADVEGVNLDEIVLADGTYSASVPSYEDYLRIQVVILNNELVNIFILDYGSTDPSRRPQYNLAVDNMVTEIIARNSTDIDTVSGATETTKALLKALAIVIDYATIE
ncbi:MAG: hypothetical protein QM489_05745 [Candidatus Izemoplasma sp.]